MSSIIKATSGKNTLKLINLINPISVKNFKISNYNYNYNYNSTIHDLNVILFFFFLLFSYLYNNNKYN